MKAMMVPVFGGFAELPLVGTLRECANTSFGWQGIDDDERRYEVRYRDGASLARVPPDEFIIQIIDGQMKGAIKIERKEK